MQSIAKFLYVNAIKIKQIIVTPYFFLSVAVICLLCFSSGIYHDSITNRVYCVAEVLIHMSQQEMIQIPELNSFNVFESGIGTYAVLFMPILTSLPFVFSNCMEYRTGIVRHKLVRTKYIWSLISNCSSALISAGLVAFTGYFLFGIFTFCLFPKEVSGMVFETSYHVVLALVCTFFYGMVTSVPALFLVSFIKNEYVVVTIPFILFYIENVLVKKMSLEGYETIGKYAVDVLPLLYRFGEQKIVSILLFHIISSLLVCVIYIVWQKRRFDYGE